MKKTLLILLSLLLLTGIHSAYSQQTLSLEQCIQRAMEVNISVKQLENQAELAGLDYKQSKYDYLPNASFSTNYASSWGTFISQGSQGQTVERRINSRSSYPNLNASLSLFSGFALHYARNQKEVQFVAAKYGMEDRMNEIATNVVNVYFQVIYSDENIKVSRNRLELLNQQKIKVERQLKTGVVTRAELLNIEAQIASEKVNLINRKNEKQKALLNLRQILNYDFEQEISLQRPDPDDFDMGLMLPELGEVYAHAIGNMPEMKQAKMNIEAAEYGIKLARSAFYPSLSLSGGISTSYTTQGLIQGLNVVLIDQEQKGVLEQFDDNFRQNFSISLSVPLFSKMERFTQLKKSKINLLSSQLEYQTKRNSLQQEIQQAWFDANAAQASYAASLEQLDAAEKALEFAQSKHDAGLIDFYTYLESLNNKTNAETDLINARYDYLLKRKILGFYNGESLKF